VFLYNSDGHGAWVNSVALARRGIDATTADPYDGRIERNPDGSPQGTLHEGAANMLQEVAPADSFDDLRRGILAGQSYLLSKGITAWQELMWTKSLTTPIGALLVPGSCWGGRWVRSGGTGDGD